MAKRCARCQRNHPVTAFCKDKKNPDGLSRWCRACTATYKKQYYRKNRAILLRDMKKRYRRDPDRVRARARRYYRKNRAACIAASISYRRNNLKSVLARLRTWSASKRKTDIQYKLRSVLRSRLNRALSNRTKKPVSAVRDLGCSIDALKKRLERRFHNGMTWNNYGKHWHLDHIKPLAMFDLTKPSQARKAVHFSNLQPLLAKDNFSKNGRFIG